MFKRQPKREHQWSYDSNFDEIPANLIFYSSEEDSCSDGEKQTQLREAELKQENVKEGQPCQSEKRKKRYKQLPRKKSAQYFGSQKLIQCRIAEKISDSNNKSLYPALMGPHPIYASDTSQAQNFDSQIVQLRFRLKEWAKQYARSWAARKRRQALKQNQKIMKNNNVKIEYHEQQELQEEHKNSRIGAKYNKYSLQFKKSIVKKILDQLKSEEEPKSLRFYIVKQANLLGIHPKNITRWLQIKNIDRKQGGRKAKFPALQFKLAKFMQKNPESKRKEVIEEAKKILKNSGIDESFNFSKGWYERFRVRLKQKKVIRSMQDLMEERYKSGAFNQNQQLNTLLQSHQDSYSDQLSGTMKDQKLTKAKIQEIRVYQPKVKIEDHNN